MSGLGGLPMISDSFRRHAANDAGNGSNSQRLSRRISGAVSTCYRMVRHLPSFRASVRLLLLAPVVILASWITRTALPAGGGVPPLPQGVYSGRLPQSSPIALSGDDVFLVNVNPDV